MRRKVGDLAVENGPDIMKRIAEFASTIKTNRGENLRVLVGLQSIRVIADQKALETFRQTLYPGEIMSYSTDLTEISLLMPPRSDPDERNHSKDYRRIGPERCQSGRHHVL